MLVHTGKLLPDQWFITDRHVGRVRSLLDETGRPLPCALPGDPVSVAGLKGDDLPPSGSGSPRFHLLSRLIPSGFFTLTKEEAERLQELRQLLVEFKFKEMHGILYLPEETAAQEAAQGTIKEEDEEELEVEERRDEGSEVKGEEGKEVPALPAQKEVRIGKGVKLVYVPRHQKWKRVIEETTEEPSLPIVIKADNVGRLETLMGLLQTLAEEEDLAVPLPFFHSPLPYPSQVDVIVSGVGPVTSSDLFHAQVEVEENEHPFVPILCFGGVGLDPQAKDWLAKQDGALQERLPVRQHTVIYELIRDLRTALETAAQKKEQKTQMQALRKEQRAKGRKPRGKGVKRRKEKEDL